MLASIIYNYGKFCDDFKSTLKLGAYDYVAPFARIPACKKYDEEKVASLIFGDKSDLFDMDSAKNIYLKGTDFSTRKNLAAATEVNTILTEEFDKAFAGAQSVDKTLANAQKRADEKIADEK